MIKIDIPRVSTEDTPILRGGVTHIELHDGYISIVYQATTSKEDEKLGIFREEEVDSVTRMRRSCIDSMEIAFEDAADIYVLYIMTTNTVTSMALPSKEFGMDLMNKITEWAWI